MDLKEFLKPDWRKILLFIIIFNFSLGFYYCWFAVGGCRGNFILSGLGLFLNLLSNPFHYKTVFLIPFIIFGYFLSCLIVWVIDKKIGYKFSKIILIGILFLIFIVDILLSYYIATTPISYDCRSNLASWCTTCKTISWNKPGLKMGKQLSECTNNYFGGTWNSDTYCNTAGVIELCKSIGIS